MPQNVLSFIIAIMNITAITAEFNPFHNGHAFLLDYARRTLCADFVLILMSGNFVQRGEPAVYDKFLRTEMALRMGADLVLELPSAFATASAREFAGCAVSIAEKTGIVDTLLFGTEPGGDPEFLSCTAQLLLACEHTGSPRLKACYQESLRRSLKRGNSYPKAREEALLFVLQHGPKDEWNSFLPTMKDRTECRASSFGEDGWPAAFKASPAALSGQISLLLSSPNNILALEYLQALFLRRSSIRPAMAVRQGDGYHAEQLSHSRFASATALRRSLLSEADASVLSPYVPKDLKPLYESAPPIGPSALDVPLSCRLLQLEADGTDLSSFSDVSPELADRLRKSLHRIRSFPERVEELWTKQYTRSRASRALLHLLLGITKEQVNRLKAEDYAPFLRILGFSERAKEALLPALKKNAAVPLITKPSAEKELLSEEIRISDFYYALQAAAPKAAGSAVKNECERQIVIL